MSSAVATDKVNVVRFPAAPQSKTKFRFTRERIQKAVMQLLRLGRPFMLRDTDVPGLCLRRQTSDRLVFMLEKRHGGKLHRITLATWSANADIEAVRSKARDLSYSIMSGTYEAEAAAAKAAKVSGVDELTGMTIAEVVEAHISRSEPPLRARSVEGYRLAAKQVGTAGKLTTKPVARWSVDDVRTAYAALTSADARTSTASASGYMRCLRAAVEHWRWRFPEAMVPANIITTGMKQGHKSRWKVAEPRVRSLLAKETWPFIDAAAALTEQTEPRHAGTYRLIALLAVTGLRFREAAGLRWSEVSQDNGTLKIGEERMKAKSEFTKPVGQYAAALLKAQRDVSGGGEFVFPAANKPGVPVDDVRHAIARVCAQAGCVETVGPHDLRRTFIRAAEAVGLPVSRIKALVHHSPGKDVTAGYLGYGFIDDAGNDAQLVEDFLMVVR